MHDYLYIVIQKSLIQHYGQAVLTYQEVSHGAASSDVCKPRKQNRPRFSIGHRLKRLSVANQNAAATVKETVDPHLHLDPPGTVILELELRPKSRRSTERTSAAEARLEIDRQAKETFDSEKATKDNEWSRSRTSYNFYAKRQQN